MQLVPVQCRVCSHIYLESALVVVAANVPCECGGIARALSDQAYASEDESLFDAVVSSLFTAEISFLAAPQLLTALRQGGAQLPGAALHRLTRLAPKLAIIELIVGKDAEAARKAEAMFGIVLEALAARRSRSDVAPRMDAVATRHRSST